MDQNGRYVECLCSSKFDDYHAHIFKAVVVNPIIIVYKIQCERPLPSAIIKYALDIKFLLYFSVIKISLQQ